jgi:hypothetical protein
MPTSIRAFLVVLWLAFHSGCGVYVDAAPSFPDHRIWQASKFDSLITFGDSYTDESRMNYVFSHDGNVPPTGMLLPDSNTTASGGRTWPRYVVQYAGSESADSWHPKMTLFNYAVSGAVCSINITQR